MKYFVLLAVMAFMFLGCKNKVEVIDYNQLQVRDKIAYKVNSDKAFTGKSIEKYESGQKKYEVSFKNGKLNGKMIAWSKNGQKSYEKIYKNGELDKINIISKDEYVKTWQALIDTYANTSNKEIKVKIFTVLRQQVLELINKNNFNKKQISELWDKALTFKRLGDPDTQEKLNIVGIIHKVIDERFKSE